MGEEYPATFLLGKLTAPKRAPSHSFLRVSSVCSGRLEKGEVEVEGISRLGGTI